MKLKQLQLLLLYLVISSIACNYGGNSSTPVSDPAPAGDVEESQPDEAATDSEVAASTEVPPDEQVASPTASWLPDGTIAIFSAGSGEAGRLHALAGDGSFTDLGRDMHGSRALSVNGKWVASANSPYPATSVQIDSLESGVSYSIPLSTGYTLYGMAFDPNETRLAFMELGSDGGMNIQWAIVIVNLMDGSSTRFEATFTGGDFAGILPGSPRGWIVATDELILNTFLPNTEGFFAGLWAINIPSGTPSARLDSLPARKLIPMGDYYAQPEISRDGSRILYLNRDFNYTPADLVVESYDFAINQLWSIDFPVGSGTILLDVVDGSALLSSAAWSMSADRILFAQGTFSGADVFAELTLKFTAPGGPVVDVGALSIPPGGEYRTLDWCRPEIALITAHTAANMMELSMVAIPGAASTVVTSDRIISVLSCVH